MGLKQYLSLVVRRLIFVIQCVLTASFFISVAVSVAWLILHSLGKMVMYFDPTIPIKQAWIVGLFGCLLMTPFLGVFKFFYWLFNPKLGPNERLE